MKYVSDEAFAEAVQWTGTPDNIRAVKQLIGEDRVRIWEWEAARRIEIRTGSLAAAPTAAGTSLWVNVESSIGGRNWVVKTKSRVLVWDDATFRNHYHPDNSPESPEATAGAAEMAAMLNAAADGGGRIVSSNDLLPEQIQQAREQDRLAVSSDGLGWVLLPWHLSTEKDKQRETKLLQTAGQPAPVPVAERDEARRRNSILDNILHLAAGCRGRIVAANLLDSDQLAYLRARDQVWVSMAEAEFALVPWEMPLAGPTTPEVLTQALTEAQRIARMYGEALDKAGVRVAADGSATGRSRSAPAILAQLLREAPTADDAHRMRALIDIITERQRQVEEKGFSPEHDDRHDRSELALAAAAFCLAKINDLRKTFSTEMGDGQVAVTLQDAAEALWPWNTDEWEPESWSVFTASSIAARIRNLVKAAAMIIAEIERLDRITNRKAQP